MSYAVETPSSSGSSDPRLDRSMPMEMLEQIDAVCQTFEEQWQQADDGATVSLDAETFLGDWSGPARRALLRELLAIELEYRRKRGEPVAADALRARFPSDGDVIDLVIGEAALAAAADGAPSFLRDHPRYRIIRRIGSGGMGTVFLAEHSILCRPVAVKVIRPELLSKSAARERFLLEARVAGSLAHPNIVAVHDAEASPEGPFLVMEYVAGTDLARTIREHGPLSVSQACDAVRQAAEGLGAAFEAGLVHRDLSPRNLIRTDDGDVKLLDFGLAILHGPRSLSAGAASDELAGSIEYMAPEQAESPGKSDIRSDIYSLGCVLWFLLTGSAPRRIRSIQQLKAEPAALPPRLAAQRPDAPPALDAVLAKLLAPRPEDRYQTPGDVAAALEPFCIDTNASSAAGTSDAAKSEAGRNGVALPAGSGQRRGLRVAALVLAVAALVGGSVGVWNAARRASPSEQAAMLRKMYREALKLLSQRQEKQARQAIARLESVVAQSPDDANAWATLATAWNLIGDYGWELPGNAFPRAIRAGERAVEIDPELADAHLALAFAWHSYDCDWARAGKAYQEALDLDPELPAAHHWHAWFLAQQGKFAEAREEIEKAQDLAPDDLIIVNNVGKILYYSGKFSEAAEKHRYALSLDPDFRKAHLDLGYALVELDKIDDALDEFDKAAGISEVNSDVAAARVFALARSGQQEEARAELAVLEPTAAEGGLALEMAHIYAALGEADTAFQWLNTAMRLKSPGRAGLLVDPRLKPLRSDPRFEALLRTIGLAPPAKP